MDQIKPYLVVAMRHAFWIGSVIVLLGSVAVWYVATGKLAEESKAQASKIDTAVTVVSSVQGELSTLPNDLSHKEMDAKIEKRQQEVLESWKTLYDRQRDVLVWPVKELHQDFVDEFKDLIPIEKTIRPDGTDNTGVVRHSSRLLGRYDRYIRAVLPSIAAVGGCNWTHDIDSSSDVTDMTGMGDNPLVVWGTTSQEELSKNLFVGDGSPTALEVYYSQENLWILRQLMEVIATVNGDASQPYEAKIHEIKKLQIGKEVEFEAGATSAPGFVAPNTGDGVGAAAAPSGGFAPSMGGMGMGAAPAKKRNANNDPADDRYIGLDLKPITGSALRSALSSKQPRDASLAIAKRVPIMMSLDMEQSAISELIAACGNARLMIDVKQVRMLQRAGSARASKGSGSGNPMGGGMGGMGGGMGMGGMGGVPTEISEEEEDAPDAVDDEFPSDMNFQVYGVIYIYNPPDRTQLGLAEVTEEFVDQQAAAEQARADGTGAVPQPTQSNDALPTPAASADDAAPQPEESQPAAVESSPEPPATTPPAATPPDGTAPGTTPDGAAPTPPTAVATPLAN